MKSLEVLDAAETVLSALADGSAFPQIHRNAVLDDAFEVLEAGEKVYANLVDGDLDLVDRANGAAAGAYELSQGFLIELIVSAPSDRERRTALARLVETIGDSLTANPTLGGACDDCEIVGLQRLDQATDGVANVTGWTLECAALFYSDRRY